MKEENVWSSMNNPIITLEGVEKRFGNNHVVKNMNLEITEGEFLT